MATMNNNHRHGSTTKVIFFLLLPFLANNNMNNNIGCHAFQTPSILSTNIHRRPTKTKTRQSRVLQMSSEIRPNNENNQQPSQSTNDNNRLLAQDEISTSSNLPSPENDKVEQEASSLLSSMFGLIKESISSSYHKPPPLQIEDVNVLFYDVFLILNLSMSISFWVTHRMDLQYLGVSISEGSLFCLLWIISGLYYGAFLYSAVDGHYGSTSDQGGPRAAGLLGLHTFIGTCNLRILSALGMAVVEHREVGSMPGEDLIPLEIAFGLVLMSIWRALHSSFTPRI